MKTTKVAWLLIVSMILVCWLPAAALETDTVNVEILSVSVDNEGFYDISIQAEVERGGEPAQALDISLLLIGNKNNGLADNQIQVTVNGASQTAYIYHADMVNTAADDVQNGNAEHVYVWNFKAALPKDLIKTDYVYAFVGVQGRLRTDVEVILPNAFLTVNVSTTESDYSIPVCPDQNTSGSRNIPFSVEITHQDDGVLTVPPQEIVWSVETAGEIKEDLTGKVSVNGGLLTITSAAAQLEDRTLTVKASYNGAVGGINITLVKNTGAATYLSALQPEPIEVPVSGQVDAQLEADVLDQYGAAMDAVVSWSLENEIEGIQVNAQSGILTVSDAAIAFLQNAAQKQINVLAQSGTLKQEVPVQITADRTPVSAVILGAGTVSVKDQARTEYELKIADKYGTLFVPEEAVEWKISAGNDIAEIRTDGAKAWLSLGAAAEAGNTVTLSAVCGSLQEVKKNISIIADTPAPASVEIMVSAEQNSEKPQIAVPDPGAENVECVWTARVLNQFGNPMNEYNQDIVWSVIENTEGAVTIAPLKESSSARAEAKLSVSSDAFKFGKITVQASYGNAQGRKELYLTTAPVASAMEIQGDSVISARSNSSVSKAYTAKVLDQYGRGMLQNVRWSLKQPAGGVSLSADGVLKIAGAASGSAVLVASTQGKLDTITAEKTVSIQIAASGGGFGGGRGSGGGGAVVPVPIPVPQPEPVPQPQSAGDLPQEHWAYQNIKKMMERGLVKGDGGTGNIRPEEAILREEVVSVLIRALDIPEKTDAVLADGDFSSEWAAGTLAAAAEAGIIQGEGAGLFSGQNKASRIEVMVMTARAFGLKAGNTDVLKQFADGAQVPEWAAEATAALVEAGVAGGYGDGTIRPLQDVTRAEAFVMIEKLISFQE